MEELGRVGDNRSNVYGGPPLQPAPWPSSTIDTSNFTIRPLSTGLFPSDAGSQMKIGKRQPP